MKRRLLTESAPLLGLAAWFYFSAKLPAFVLPHPVEVGALTWRLFTHPELVGHTAASILRVFLAVLAATAVGFLLAVTAYAFPILQGLVNERITPFFNAFPTLGWAILAVFWFRGSPEAGVVFVQAAILLPFVLITLWEGCRSLDPGMVEMGRSLTKRKWPLLTKVVVPLLMPYLFAAVRLCYGVGWKVALVAEIFGTNRGLGYLLTVARARFDSVLLFAVILAVILLVFLGDRLVFAPVQRRLTRWQAA